MTSLLSDYTIQHEVEEMLITVEVTKTELEEMGMTRDELKQSVIADLNNSDVDGDYVGFNVIVIIGQQVKR